MKEFILKNNFRLLSIGLLSAAVLAPFTPSIAYAAPADAGPETRYIVSYDDNANIAETGKKIGNEGGKVDKTFKNVMKGSTVIATAKEAEAIEDLPGVKAIEVDQKVKAFDAQQNAPWGLDRSDQRDLPLDGTYNYDANAGKGVNIYVMDTGILANHTEFTGRMNPGMSVVNDGLGTSDCSGHGTHVAGIAGGTTYGVAKSATITPVRVFGCDATGYMSAVIGGLDWIAADHVAGTPAVANLSLGAGPSPATDAAVQKVIDDGVTVTVSAGNSAADSCNVSPARVQGAITVAATNKTDNQASFSNFGTCVDLYAPGDTILSAWKDSTTASTYYSGTSMAAPAVAGTAAILLNRNPALTPAQVATTITEAATPGIVKNTTAGTPNLLLNIPVAPPAPVIKAPDAPTELTAIAKLNGAKLSWIKGAENGSALTKQTINVYDGETKTHSFNIGPSYSGVTLSGFPAGKTYTYTVTGTNALGTSAESVKSNAVTTLGNPAPSAPTAVNVWAGAGSAIVSWTKGSDNGSALTSQVITVYNGTTVVKRVTVPASTTMSSIDGLYNGTYYTFTVKAVSSAGTGAESVKSAEITPTAKEPNPATSVKAIARDGAASISWVKGSEKGAPLTSQIITIYSGSTKVGSATISGSYSSVKLTGLTPGQEYSFTVKEVNRMGTSIESVKSNIVTPS